MNHKQAHLTPHRGSTEKQLDASASGAFLRDRNGDALARARQAIERDIDAEEQHGKVRIIMANGQKGPDA